MTDGKMQDFALTLDRFLTHAAKWHPQAGVVTAGAGEANVRIGYAELEVRSRKVSAALQRLGISPGDRVATLAWNTQAHVEAWYGVMGMGAVCHTLNPRLTAAQSGDMAAQSGARFLIADAALLGLAAQICKTAPGLRGILMIDADDPPAEDIASNLPVTLLEDLIAAEAADAEWGAFPETAPSGLCFTSGTTGAPKGVTYTHRSSFLHTLRVLQADVMAISAADSVLAVVPMFHANAWGLPFAAPAAGAKLVLPGRQTDGASLARLIASEKVTIGVGVPTVWLGLVDHVDAAGLELPSLNRIIVGGSPMPPALMARLEKRLGVTVQTSWGMTELSPLGVIMPPGAATRPAEIAGRPAVGVDLLLTDADGHPLAEQRGPEGHLRVRGAAVVERYFGAEEPAVDAEGWFATGDLARIDAAGHVRITGRAKDLIKSGGEWINPADIEAIVGALPEIALAAVIGREDPKWGERPHLLVEVRPGHTISDEAILGALRGKVASWWVPDSVQRLRTMPLATTGKIDKLRLRAEYGQSPEDAKSGA
ncbi:AMP-binding protein [Hyphomonas sp.]|uniref:AMP-binding protein n=1 Tax=Hyphomonas sp. TaxID=87 RepID=UPI00391B90AD